MADGEEKRGWTTLWEGSRNVPCSCQPRTFTTSLTGTFLSAWRGVSSKHKEARFPIYRTTNISHDIQHLVPDGSIYVEANSKRMPQRLTSKNNGLPGQLFMYHPKISHVPPRRKFPDTWPFERRENYSTSVLSTMAISDA